MGTHTLTNRQLATVLAALRYWQREGLLADSCAEADVATDGGTLEPLKAKEVDELCEKLNPVKPLKFKDFVIASVSSNTNSFGLQGMILIAQDGEAWKVGANGINVKKKGTFLKVPTFGGEPDFSPFGFEIPERLKPDAPPGAVKEAWA